MNPQVGVMLTRWPDPREWTTSRRHYCRVMVVDLARGHAPLWEVTYVSDSSRYLDVAERRLMDPRVSPPLAHYLDAIARDAACSLARSAPSC